MKSAVFAASAAAATNSCQLGMTKVELVVMIACGAAIGQMAAMFVGWLFKALHEVKLLSVLLYLCSSSVLVGCALQLAKGSQVWPLAETLWGRFHPATTAVLGLSQFF